MRRKDREVTDFNTIVSIIDECHIIRIGLSDGDYPYIVPLNFGYRLEGQQIYFYIHGSKFSNHLSSYGWTSFSARRAGFFFLRGLISKGYVMVKSKD